ncbi:MAG: signal peptidase II [Clostridia bacterium]|nr:signal peptidase II [Clostridia bacterium]MBQ3553764.1 signal peptidase II [Clostridia bacterium]
MKGGARLLGLFFVGVGGLLLLDQLSKWLVLETLTKVDTQALIEGVLHFTYCENRGAAFGILENQIWFFIVITVLVLFGVGYYMVRYRPTSKWLNGSLLLLTGGALGNFVDRIFRGYVIDFIDFRLIDFAIFNVADCFVVVGACMLAIYMIFSEYKKEKNK